ncbi:MAG: glycosyltransferase, partial [Chloroflexota bacterium]|nr:glycosyltransferase [Chloroflexota bacterium]
MNGRLTRDLLHALVFLPHLALSYRLLRYRREVAKLSAVVPSSADGAGRLPRLSIIVPARNEERSLESAVDSLLRQDYPALELVLVDDRSTDRTGQIIARLAAAHPDWIQAITVDRLPPGWLGKNHALWLGALRASGDWLLFADADIVFAPNCCRLALTYAAAAGIDHLTLFPRFTAPGYWLDAFVSFFVYTFVTYQRPYLVQDPRSGVGIGVGAFNLIRRAAYVTIGTHAAIALRPDDDTRLGRRVKLLGLRSHIL